VTLTEELVAEMVFVSGRCSSREDARALVQDAWDSGAAFSRLEAWIAAQGGRLHPEREDFGLTVAPLAGEVTASGKGQVAAIACREIGRALGDLGGARLRVDEGLDLSAGIDFRVAVGDVITPDQPLASLYCHDPDRAVRAADRIRAAITITDEIVNPPSLILDRLSGY
jgi:thymidine phosphorylase